MRKSRMNTVPKHSYTIECFDKHGNLRWREDFDNLVVYEGLNKYLDAALKSGLSSPTLYIGLVAGGTNTYSLSDTLASHPGWSEFTSYSGNRKQFVPGTISNGSVSNSENKASFTITSNGTVAGAFLCYAETGTGGVLMGVGDFEGGSRSVQTDDVLNVTLTASMSNPS